MINDENATEQSTSRYESVEDLVAKTIEQTSEPPTVPDSILQEADRIAGNERSRDYGHPFINHRRIAAFWNILLEDHLKTPLTPLLVAEMMILLKCARLMNTYKRDSVVDIAGYAKCMDEIMQHLGKANNGV